MKRLIWLGSSLEDLKDFPEEVKDEVGHSLLLVQLGGKPSSAKPLKGFHGASMLEIVEDFNTDTYRAVYTVRFEEAVYVLHCFQKKSKSGISTPLQDFNLIEKRYKQAEKEHQEWLNQQAAPSPKSKPAPKKRRSK